VAVNDPSTALDGTEDAVPLMLSRLRLLAICGPIAAIVTGVSAVSALTDNVLRLGVFKQPLLPIKRIDSNVL
jgi:hypothetical protein